VGTAGLRRRGVVVRGSGRVKRRLLAALLAVGVVAGFGSEIVRHRRGCGGAHAWAEGHSACRTTHRVGEAPCGMDGCPMRGEAASSEQR
jgi:hypothetical protein